MEERAVKKLHPDSDHFVILHAREARGLPDDIKALINKMGVASSSAQGLNHVITSLKLDIETYFFGIEMALNMK